MRSLVAYDTRYGSAAEAAKNIVQSLARRGIDADLLDLRQGDAPDLTDYDAVIVGGPYYMGHWSRRALEYLRKNQSDLERKQLGIFTVGLDAKLGTQAARERIPPALGSRLSCQAHFGGRINPDRLKPVERLVLRFSDMPGSGMSTMDFSAAERLSEGLAS